MLTKRDRCDASECGAQAIYRYEKPSQPGNDLLFCNHHSNKFLDGLSKCGFVKVDSEELVEV